MEVGELIVSNIIIEDAAGVNLIRIWLVLFRKIKRKTVRGESYQKHCSEAVSSPAINQNRIITLW